ncbi:MAG: HNH endonuclease signature motif containing protein [Candidatus Daviesbacteria bacterium]|nr:HNH endonuclease signature motif containing protein [Candidatus Daviesbacteria bacterium]
MRPAFYDNSQYKQKQSEITRKNWQTGLFDSLKKPLEIRKCRNPECKNSFQVKPYDPKSYCSSHCSALVNNLNRPKKSFYCKTCKNKLNRFDNRYCSIKCQNLYRYNIFIKNWKSGLENGNKGITTKILSAHIKHYLIKKYGKSCSVCSWHKKNPITKKVPLEVDHIDGNSSNNIENNLRLICPNCHALTPHFRNLNKGNGRAWRLKYIKQNQKSNS